MKIMHKNTCSAFSPTNQPTASVITDKEDLSRLIERPASKSRSLLNITAMNLALNYLTQSREGKATGRKVHRNKPRTNKIDQVVKKISVRDAVNGGVDGKREQEDVSEIPKARRDSRHHFSGCQSLDKKNKGHY